MRTLTYWLFAFLGIALLQACSSGKRAYEQGNYDAAVGKSVARLRSNPSHGKARNTLSSSYRMAIDYHQKRIASLKSSGQTFRWEPVVSSYISLNSMHDDIMRCPACLTVVPSPMSFRAEEESARRYAAEARYNAGMEELRKGTREAGKAAYQHFQRVRDYVANYQDAEQRMEEARWMATLKVLFEKVPVYSQRYQLSDEYFTNKMFEFVTQNRRMNEFVMFYSPAELSDPYLQNPNHVVRMQFDDFNVGQVYVQERVENLSKDSVVVGQVDVNGEKRDVYGTVKAKFTSFRKTVTSNGVLDMKIYDPATNRLLLQEKFPGEFVWVSEWGTFQGDERALSAEQRRVANTREAVPPPPDQLFIEFTQPIYTRATERLRSFYRGL